MPTPRTPTRTLEDRYGIAPQGVFLPPGGELSGAFVSIAMSPPGDYGQCPIVRFTAIDNGRVLTTKGEIELDPGADYTIWLTSEMLRRAFIRNAPRAGEVFSVWYRGRRQSGERLDSKGNPQEYAEYHLRIEGRDDTAGTPELTWEQLASDEDL